MTRIYKLLIGLPWKKAGTLYIGCGDKGMYHDQGKVYRGEPCGDKDRLPAGLIINYPEYFELVAEPK